MATIIQTPKPDRICQSMVEWLITEEGNKCLNMPAEGPNRDTLISAAFIAGARAQKRILMESVSLN